MQQLGQAVAVKNIVAEDQCRRVCANKIATDMIGLSQTLRLGLHGIMQRKPHRGPISQQRLKCRLILRRRDDHDLADAGHDQNRKRIIDHWLVIYRHELLRDGLGQRI